MTYGMNTDLKRSGPRKLHAVSLEAQGRPEEARRVWLQAAAYELRALRKTQDELSFRNGIGEVVACLACAAAVHRRPPLLKEGVRAVVKRFMDRVIEGSRKP